MCRNTFAQLSHSLYMSDVNQRIYTVGYTYVFFRRAQGYKQIGACAVEVLQIGKQNCHHKLGFDFYLLDLYFTT